MNKTKWIIFAVIVMAIFAGLFFINKNNNNTPAFTGNANYIINDGPIADHALGSKDQKVVLIEYADYQCPACSYTYQTAKTLVEKYGDKLTFIFREFPLTSIHPNALAAATVAEAAGLQGKYFEMHNLLYQNQNSWSELNSQERSKAFEDYANQIGLDINKYKSDLTSKDISDKISRDTSTGRNTFKISGTPTFVLDGTVIDSSVGMDADALSKKVEEAINKAYPQVQQ